MLPYALLDACCCCRPPIPVDRPGWGRELAAMPGLLLLDTPPGPPPAESSELRSRWGEVLRREGLRSEEVLFACLAGWSAAPPGPLLLPAAASMGGLKALELECSLCVVGVRA